MKKILGEHTWKGRNSCKLSIYSGVVKKQEEGGFEGRTLNSSPDWIPPHFVILFKAIPFGYSLFLPIIKQTTLSWCLVMGVATKRERRAGSRGEAWMRWCQLWMEKFRERCHSCSPMTLGHLAAKGRLKGSYDMIQWWRGTPFKGKVDRSSNGYFFKFAHFS